MTEPIRFEREEVLSLLLKRVDGFRAGYRQNVALLGVRGIGKSTLLRHLVRERLGQDRALVAVYIETGESENLVEWSAKLVRSLFYAALQACALEDLPVRWEELAKACSERFPKTAGMGRKILELAEAGKPDQAYHLCWELPNLLAQELNCRVLLVLDEFHGLRRLPVKEPFRVLGRSVMVQSSTMFLVASSEEMAARGILREGLALLFGQFETIEMGPVDVAACLKSIRSVWPLREPDPCAVSFLVDLGQGHPESLQQMIHGLRGWKPPEREMVSPDRIVLDVMETLLWHPNALLRQRFEARLKTLPDHWSRLACVQLLSAIASGAHRLPQMAEVADRSLSQIRKFLEILEQTGWVEKESSFHVIPDRLFRFWLVTAYPASQGVGLTDSAQGRAHFRQEALRWIRRFREAFQQPFEERAADFLKAWKEEQVLVDGRRLLLPLLDKIRMKPLDPAGCLLIGEGKSASRRGWLFVLWKNALTETEARRIIQQISEDADLRDHRRVMVSLRMPEVNARLILQQSKIKVWDLAVLNRLLELYGLPTFLTSDPAPEHWFPAQPVQDSLSNSESSLGSAGAAG
ncbi:MAG: ATP-binding protein [Candidatus Omnitrophica bacterium]|nr:ATP-binding protein [Candidatus Omnitrophota bacterium]